MIKILSVLRAMCFGLFCCWLSGCATTDSKIIAQNAQLFLDHQFIKPPNIPLTDSVFTLKPTQRDWLDKTVRKNKHESLTHQLINNVLRRDYGLFDYDNSYTRTASQTLESGQGNCLSMVIMTASIAKYLGIKYKVNDIQVAPMWDRDGGLYLINGHVNIQLENGNTSQDSLAYEFFKSPYITLDFINNAGRRHLSKRVISEQELIAMYYVNLAADAMVAKQWNRAYWLLRQSLSASPAYSPAWNSLGVLYKRNNLKEKAEAVYRYAISLDKNNINVVSNLALLLEGQGRYQELFNYQRKVDLAQLKNPYRYYDQAEFAYETGDYKGALSLYKKAVKVAPIVDAFHFGVYRAYLALGDNKAALKSLKMAHKRSADYQDRKRYNAKLALLQQ